MSQTDTPSAHPTKRKRVNEETDSIANGVPSIERSSQFWFKDGSIVIQAESTQFRVHHSVLSLHSTVLKDCFQLPQPDGEPTVEGCPVLHLSDSPKDIEHLLSLFYALYDTADFRKPIPFAITSVTIRLGRKYDLVRFVEDAIGRLNHGFPKTLQNWDEVDHTQVFTDAKGLLFDIINFAYEFSLNSVLPCAFLRLCEKYSLREILLGEERDDQTTASLSHEALQTCLIGRDRIARVVPHQMVDSLARDYPHIGFGHCASPKRCVEIHAFVILPSFFEPITGESDLKIRFPARQCPRPGPDVLFAANDCAKCEQNVSDLYGVIRATLWNKLPKYFGWENWSL
ncbi:hypothetical protein GALMADRAFT_65536 [Galerina marginata CBS 339.88]|uniref:BTB domain-containing protein n=1 Tax=Galerina marginata (strain CBS 339.88) TaxID=685588 RepID=A0A067TC11_GALM3|nr:hypothetical protein GALMADRAFT_65536 [Galerina marginata CBS 339.88]